MKKASEYREHAEECRRLAKTAIGEHRTHLEKMAKTWEELARDRERRIAQALRISELEQVNTNEAE